MQWLTLIGLFACVSRHTPSPAAVEVQPAFDAVVASASLPGIISIDCNPPGHCSLHTADGTRRFSTSTGEVTSVDDTPHTASEPWAVSESGEALEVQWNAQVKNTWRSPFRAQIPSPDGGHLRIQRGLTPGTSRVVRLGGSVLTARQSPDPGRVAYPNALALHPTGTEAYLVVWPNPFLTAFNVRTLKTTWRISIGDAAQGLFVSEDGRYLVVETGGSAPEHQMLDYEPEARTAPEGVDPSSDETFQWLSRPEATATVLVDLGSGTVATQLPGPFTGFALQKDGAIIASQNGITRVRHSPIETTP